MANRGGETATWSVPYLWTCADGTPEPKCLNRRAELCQPGSNGLARVLTAGQLDRIVQQRSITAPHHALARCHETACFVFARIAFPIGLGAMKAKESFGDGPVALAALARVEGAQCQDMQFPELIWHRPKGAARRPAVKSAPQSPRRMRAQLEQGVERQSQGIGRGGVRRLHGEPKWMDGPARAPQAMPASVGTPEIKAGKMRQVDRRCCGG